MFTGKPSHLSGFDYTGGYRYFLTFCTFRRRRLFTAAPRVTVARTQIVRAAIEQRFAITAYCFMPDHVHLLVEGATGTSNVLTMITRAKQYSGFHYRKEFGEPLWQRYGFERTLRGNEATLSVARYIVENPVRAGLVRDCRDYPFVGSETNTLDEILEAVQMMSSWRSG